MAAESVAATAARPTDVGLKRDMGLVGAIWSSETSLIGSGWLFGSLFAAQAVGTAALALLGHRRRHRHRPRAGARRAGRHVPGVAAARRGSRTSRSAASRGIIVRLLLLAPGRLRGADRVLRGDAVRPVLVHRHGIDIYNPTTKVTTGLGFLFTIILHGHLHGDQLPRRMRLFNRVNSVDHGVEGGHPHPGHHRAVSPSSRASNFSAGGGFMPDGLQSVFGAMPTAGIVFAYLGFEQADQLAGEIKNPQKNLPRAIIIAIALASSSTSCSRSCSSARSRTRVNGPWLARPRGHQPDRRRAVRRPGRRGRVRLAGQRSCGSTRSSRRSAPA